MKDSPLKAFLKYIFFHKLQWQNVVQILYIVIFIFLLYIYIKYGLPSKVLWWTYGIITLIYSIFMWVDIFKSYYNYFKKYEYGKVIIPEKIEEIKSEVSPDTWLIIKNLEERVSNIEKNLSPFRLTLYSIFVGISVAVALLLIALLLQKILFPK